MIPTEYLLENFGLLHREPLRINLFIGTIVIRVGCICTGKRDGMVHCLLQMIFVEITHIVVMEINFIVIVRILIILLLQTFILVVWKRAQCWPHFLGQKRFNNFISVQGWGLLATKGEGF